MSDARQVWQQASDAKRRTIRSLWPELAEALEGNGTAAGEAPKVRHCVIGDCAGKQIPAVGRLNGRFGHPVCRRHADRFGGTLSPL